MDINFVLKDPRGQGLASDCIPQFWEKSRVGGSKIVSMQLSRRFPMGSRYSDQSIIYNSFRTRHNSRSSIWESEWVRSHPVKGPGFNPRGRQAQLRLSSLIGRKKFVAISLQWV